MWNTLSLYLRTIVHVHAQSSRVVLGASFFVARRGVSFATRLPGMPFDSVSAAGASLCDHAALERDDVELWLIRCPPGFDPSELHDRTVDLTQEATPLGTGSQATGYCLRPIPAAESSGMVGVFPSAGRKRWMVGKPVAQQFAVSATPSAAAAAVSSHAPTPLPPVPQVEGLRLRHAFIGGTVPPPAAAPPSKKRAADEAPPAESKKKKAKKSDGKEPGKKKAPKDRKAVV